MQDNGLARLLLRLAHLRRLAHGLRHLPRNHRLVHHQVGDLRLRLAHLTQREGGLALLRHHLLALVNGPVVLRRRPLQCLRQMDFPREADHRLRFHHRLQP